MLRNFVLLSVSSALVCVGVALVSPALSLVCAGLIVGFFTLTFEDDK